MAHIANLVAQTVKPVQITKINVILANLHSVKTIKMFVFALEILINLVEGV